MKTTGSVLKKSVVLLTILSALILALTACGTGIDPDDNKPTQTVSYTVTFNTVGGSNTPAQTVESGKTAARPTTDPTKAGYIFDDWYTGGFVVKFDFAAAITANATVYAKWTANTGNQAQQLTAPANLQINDSNKTLTWNAVSNASGYTAQVDGITVYFDTATAYSLAGLTAPGIYLIRVKAIGNGATYTDSAWSTAKSYTVSESNPQAEQLSAPANLQINETTKTLTWNAVSNASGYTVQVDSNAPVAVGTATAYSLAGLTYDGTYSIKVKALGNGATYADSAWSAAASYTVIVTYTVQFNSKGGAEVGDQTVSQGAKLNIPEVSRYGYLLDGWYTSINGGATLDEKWSFLNNAVNNNLTLYAKWIANTYTMTYDGNKPDAATVNTAGSTANSVHAYNIEKALTANGYILAGWAFAGWNTLANGGGIAYIDEQRVNNLSAMPNATITLYAQWTKANIIYSGATLGNGTYETAYSASAGGAEANGGTFTYTLKTANTLPAGLSLNASSGQISGTITASASATPYGFIVAATCAESGAKAEAQFYITVNKANQIISDGTIFTATIVDVIDKVSLSSLGSAYEYSCDNSTWGASNIFTALTVNASYTFYARLKETSNYNASAPLTVARQITPIDSDMFIFNGNTVSGLTTVGKIFTAITVPTQINGTAITSIAASAFLNCTNIQSVVIPNNITSIGSAAFRGCIALTSITLPFVGTSGTATGTGALFGYIFGTSSYTGGTATEQYYSSSSYTTYYIPTGLRTVNITAASKLEYGAFYKCNGLASVTIGSGVTTIGDYAFYFCQELMSTTIPSGVATIGAAAFVGCIKLANITIPSGVTTIGLGAFLNCNEFTNITIPNSVTSIGNGAFSYCGGLTGITLSTGVTTIGPYMFQGCIKLANITIPSGVTIIAVDAFSGCSGLTSITIPTGVTAIGEGAFDACSKLTKVNYRGSLTQWNAISIGAYNTPLVTAAKVYNYV